MVGIDNDRGRADAAQALAALGIPAVFFAVSRDTFTYEVFVQEAGGKPCWACMHRKRFERAKASAKTPCPKVPAIADPCLVATGLCCYALDSLIMGRPRAWNLREGHLHGEVSDRVERIEGHPECFVCSTG